MTQKPGNKPGKKAGGEPIPAKPESHPPRHQRVGDAGFGEEGSNKTLPTPQAHAEPAAQLQGTKSKYIPKTPYTRG